MGSTWNGGFLFRGKMELHLTSHLPQYTSHNITPFFPLSPVSSLSQMPLTRRIILAHPAYSPFHLSRRCYVSSNHPPRFDSSDKLVDVEWILGAALSIPCCCFCSETEKRRKISAAKIVPSLHLVGIYMDIITTTSKWRRLGCFDGDLDVWVVFAFASSFDCDKYLSSALWQILFVQPSIVTNTFSPAFDCDKYLSSTVVTNPTLQKRGEDAGNPNHSDDHC